jgi:hypothetical protein
MQYCNITHIKTRPANLTLRTEDSGIPDAKIVISPQSAKCFIKYCIFC